MQNYLINTYLSKIIENQKIPPLLLFAGSRTSPSVEAAKNFAKQLVNVEGEIHPDLYYFFPEGKLGVHGVDHLRQLREDVYLPPYQSKYKVFIIFEADRMATVGSNTLLKTFEEPLSTSRILLVSAYPEKILPTIRSRCQTLYFQEEKGLLKLHTLSVIPILKALLSHSIPSLLDMASELAQDLEKQTTVQREEQEQWNANEKNTYEKQCEGEEALNAFYCIENIWKEVAGWYRDLHLLALNGNLDNLIHTSEKEFLQTKLESGNLLGFEEVLQVLKQVKQRHERSTPFRHVLEDLILELRQREC